MENSSNAETYALTRSGYARAGTGSGRAPRRGRNDGGPGHDDRGLRTVDYCSTGCGASALSCAWMTGELLSVATSILRGFAFSLTGMVTLSTPLL
jgi:hypothetical protein